MTRIRNQTAVNQCIVPHALSIVSVTNEMKRQGWFPTLGLWLQDRCILMQAVL